MKTNTNFALILLLVASTEAFKRSDTFRIDGSTFCGQYGIVESVNMAPDYKAITCKLTPETFRIARLSKNYNDTAACRNWANGVSFLYTGEMKLFDAISCGSDSSSLTIRLNDGQTVPNDDNVITCGIPKSVHLFVRPKSDGPCGPHYNSASGLVSYMKNLVLGLALTFPMIIQ